MSRLKGWCPVFLHKCAGFAGHVQPISMRIKARWMEKTLQGIHPCKHVALISGHSGAHGYLSYFWQKSVRVSTESRLRRFFLTTSSWRTSSFDIHRIQTKKSSFQLAFKPHLSVKYTSRSHHVDIIPFVSHSPFVCFSSLSLCTRKYPSALEKSKTGCLETCWWMSCSNTAVQNRLWTSVLVYHVSYSHR